MHSQYMTQYHPIDLPPANALKGHRIRSEDPNHRRIGPRRTGGGGPRDSAVLGRTEGRRGSRVNI